MEPLLQHLERFCEVLAVSRTTHVDTWDPATLRRALQWARYLRHVHRRFGRHSRIRKALEQRLHKQWRQDGRPGPTPASGLTNFESLGRCDSLLALRLLENRALGDAACHHLLQLLFPGPGVQDTDEETLQDSLALLARRRSAVRMLHLNGYRENPVVEEDSLLKTQAELLLQRLQEAGALEAEGPCSCLSRLWEHLPQNNFLKVIATALLLPPPPPPLPPLSTCSQEEKLDLCNAKTPGEERRELVRWLLEKSDIMVVFCRNLPAGLLASVIGRHPELFRVYLGLLTDWGCLLHYDLQKGSWVGAKPQDLAWEELYDRFQSLCQAASPVKDEVLTTLKSYRARDGDFQVPGLSIWTDLLVALENSGT
ncbi:PREDICTED: Fanconi anemia group F protein [Chrysochloris asiatica]|uniref:Fanconi anemia group F protein n=1 Tax=Chrysochloris asiatica TaxID=185453 RepID=A0A9B0WZ69_CHRAS|nr:PREDICTED: Fanconi anemia group F protein [Chrysochloris asiatica]